MKKSLMLVVITSIIIGLTSCATSIKMTVTRPAELDLQGAETISVLPFKTSEAEERGGTLIILDLFGIHSTKPKNPDEVQISEYLTSQVTQALLESPYVKVVGSKAIQTAIENGTEIPADVYLSGKISNFSNAIKVNTRKETVDDNDVYIDYFYRDVSFTVTYEVISAKTNNIISYKTVNLANKSYESKDRSDISDCQTLMRRDIDELVAKIAKQLQPYTEDKYVTLLEDKTKNPMMSLANDYAKEGDLVKAQETYMHIYETENDFVAGFNAAKIMEARSLFDDALKLMQELVTNTGDKRAVKALKDIEYEISSADALKQQTEK